MNKHKVDYYEFMIGLYKAGHTNYDITKHEDWELPPIEDMREYLIFVNK